ncbi:hypothetical protein [Anaeromassilibacillus sp. SJQ-1]
MDRVHLHTTAAPENGQENTILLVSGDAVKFTAPKSSSGAVVFLLF